MKIERKILVLIILALVFISFNVYFLFKTNSSTNKQNPIKVSDLKSLKSAIDYIKTKESLNPQNMLTDESTSEATPKEKLKMQLLNGSGIPGTATALKNSLEQLGLLITVDNTTATSSTTLKVKPSVPEKTKNEIISGVRKKLTEIDQEALSEDFPWDIILIIGKP